MKTVTIYGATSFTGSQHLVPYLDSQYAGQINILLAGRNRSKLEALNASLSGSNEKFRSIAALTLDDPAAVKTLVEKSDVIINLAGALLCGSETVGQRGSWVCGRLQWCMCARVRCALF